MKITYGGVEITKYLSPMRGLDRKILPEMEHELSKIGNTDGYVHTRSVLGKRTIPMPFKIKNELIKNRRELARVLSTRVALPLIFGDEAEKFWLALPSGDISVDELVFQGKGVIDWIVPDGVAHAVQSRVFTNVATGTAATENQVLDPEYKRKEKYYKPWVSWLQEKYAGSNILRGDFTDTATIADQGETKYKGLRLFQNPNTNGRSFPTMKLNDPVSAQVEIRINKAATGDTTGAKSVMLIVQEMAEPGGRVIRSSEATPKALNVGAFQKLTLTNIKVSAETKAINLLVGIGNASVDISKPQFNLGATLAPYAEPNTRLTEYVAVTNPGTYRAWPVITAVMNGENGLVGVVGENDALLQFGDAEEIDTVPGKRSDKVINLSLRNQPAQFEPNKGNPAYPYFLDDPSVPNVIEGEIDWKTYPEAAAPKFTANKGRWWSGPTLYKAIPKNSSNRADGDFTWRNRFNFDSNVKQRGRLTFTLQSGDKAVLSCTIRDSSPSQNQRIVDFWHGQKVIKSYVLDLKLWTGTFWEFTISKTNKTGVEFKFAKFKAFNGDEGVISDRSIIFPINLPELANTNIDGLVCWFQKIGPSPASFMAWGDSKFFWQNEPVTNNVPNQFDDGDVLQIDVKERIVRLNGYESNHIHALGNRWSQFAIEPGTTTMLPVSSTWANMFEFQVELRGAYV